MFFGAVNGSSRPGLAGGAVFNVGRWDVLSCDHFSLYTFFVLWVGFARDYLVGCSFLEDA